MRILRIHTSSDAWAGVPEELRTPALLARRLEEATGEAVTWELHTIWPSDAGAEKLEGWINEFDPEIISLRVNPFWYAWPSPAVRIARQGGPAGRFAARAVLKVGFRPRVASSAPYRLVRHLATKSTGAEYHCEPEQVVQRVDEWLRLALRHELIVPVIFGPTLTSHHDDDPRRLAQMRARMVSCNEQLRTLCGRLAVAVDARSTPDPSVPQGQSRVAADGLHLNEGAHAYEAEVEFPYLLEAWRRLRQPETIEAAAL